MATYPRTIETRLATMTMVEPGYLEQRFRPNIRIDLAGFEENRKARFTLAGDEPCVMLSVFPQEIDFDVQITSSDHFAPERGKETLIALAVVANDSMFEMVSRLYFAYFPQVFNTRVFSSEQDARNWLLLHKPAIAER